MNINSICQKVATATDLGAISFVVGKFCKINDSTQGKALFIKTALKVLAFVADVALSILFFPYGLAVEGEILFIRGIAYAGYKISRKIEKQQPSYDSSKKTQATAFQKFCLFFF